MTSCQGYNQVTDYTFMFDIPDLRSNKEIKEYDKDTITGFLYNDSNFKIFKFLIDKSNNADIYSQIQAYFTLFITPDDYILKDYDMGDFINMDLYTARQFILYNTIPKVLKPTTLLELKDITEVSSRLTSQFLQIQNTGKEIFINGSKVLFLKECKNGIIYILDKPLFPDPVYN